MAKLWGGRFRSEENKSMEDFNSSFPFDKRLYKEDVTGSIAHVHMLGKQGIIAREEADLIASTLQQILADIDAGSLLLSGLPEDAEDIHTFIEMELTARIGDVGKKLHTGRSRNDQVAVDMRQYARSACSHLTDLVRQLKEALAAKGKEYPCLMPGYTHLQRAQVVTFRYYMNAYVSMLERDMQRLTNTGDLMNRSPLGCAALAGTTHQLDRAMTAAELGFDGPVDNFLDGVSDRDYLLEMLSDMSIIMVHLSRLSEELILWSSSEFNFVEIDDAYATGSSIMPQKKNNDACELIRGKTGRVFGSLMGLLTTMKGLPLAYNKDMQEDKQGFFDAVDTLEACLTIMTGIISTLKVKEEVMKKSVRTGFLNATEVADYLVKKGVAFRDAHGIVGRIVIACEDRGKAIEDLTIEELREFDPVFDEEIYEFLDYRNILSKGIKKEILMD
ncbi:MAG: argininosuccinate lyase [Lachnospiraceae bacterium]|nr:argininosuccinate lyase [Lachnospiraceae bacterium]